MRALLALALAATLPTGARAQVSPADETSVKAAFVYNFAKFTEWPAGTLDRADALRICVAGPASPLSQALSTLQGKPPVQGKPVEVTSRGTPGDTRGCHVLVIPQTEALAGAWLKVVDAQPVLTIGDSEGFAASGGAIGLYRDVDRIRFEVNVEPLQRGGLKLSSQVLKLARIVKGNGTRAW